MPVNTSCPGCGKAYLLPDNLAGKTVRCKQCQKTFVARTAADEEPPYEAELAEPPKPARPPREEGLRDRPRRAASPRRRDEDDDEDRPRPRKKEAKKSSAGMILLIVGGIAAVLLLGCAGVAVVGFVLLAPQMAGGTTKAAGSVAGPGAVIQNPPGPQEGPEAGQVVGPADDMADIKAGKFVKPLRSPGPTSYLRAVSSPGDFIGGGKSYNYNGAQLRVRRSDRGVSVDVDDWNLLFGGPGRQFLKVGEYQNAKRYPFSDDSPGLEFTGHGRGCNTLVGSFVVWELELKGNEVSRVAIDFVQHCEGGGPPLYGRLRFNSNFQ